jgi:2-hydroxy-3-oxopropionate reductase
MPADLLTRKATACSSAKEVAEKADIIFSMLPNTPDVAAVLFASKAGADPAKVRQALMGGFAASRILEVHGERMIKRTFNPGFRIGLHQKDLVPGPFGAGAGARIDG